jgi:copper(I)-binding protein
MKKLFILAFIGTLLLSACGAPGDIEIHSPWVRPTAQGENAAVYLTIHNHSANPDELIGASSNMADMVEIHESKMVNDVMQMNMLKSVPVAAGEEVVFMPGGLHIMLVNVKQELKLGDHVGVILHFKNHADIVVDVQVDDTVPADSHDHP